MRILSTAGTTGSSSNVPVHNRYSACEGIDNVVADALSKINIATIETPSHIDFQEMANNQMSDKELSEILAHPDKSSLVLQPFPMGDRAIELYCDVASNRIRPFVTEMDRKKRYFPVCILFHILGLRLLLTGGRTIRMAWNKS
ncbi:reverse transcriptase [Caerostris extrusa]|uniref:Reverse transcriptase n=1 Tax=Caerostris extrusa TaxID=172846 RepID=A0AAV4SNG3_CAEEX|nr:reverse transcriptase [Caerostris extrusa]